MLTCTELTNLLTWRCVDGLYNKIAILGNSKMALLVPKRKKIKHCVDQIPPKLRKNHLKINAWPLKIGFWPC